MGEERGGEKGSKRGIKGEGGEMKGVEEEGKESGCIKRRRNKELKEDDWRMAG